ncbi:hypothetical protein L208DRAFT_1387529, partial [Tricholoma matsutake]
MPRKKPPVPVRMYYSMDVKRRVIHQAYTYNTLHKRSKDIATDLNMPLRVVQCVKKTWQEVGEVCRDRKYMGRTLFEHTPDLYLDEIQEQLHEQHDISVSLAAISRTLKRLGMSSKKVRS